MIYIPKNLIDAIKNHALANEDEIYGWLIGYQNKNDVNIIAIFECLQYEQQTLISAIPHAKEFQEISSILPQGIGPVGIYHSHPFSSEIFHSHIDDSTLLSLSNQFPNCVSIVTNGEEIEYFQMDKHKKTKRTNVKYVNPDIPDFLVFSLNLELLFKFQQNENSSKIDDSKVRIQILNSIKEFFEKSWESLNFKHDNLIIPENSKIKQFLVKNLNSDLIKLCFNEEKFSNGKVIFLKNTKEINENSTTKESLKSKQLRLSIDLKCPIYTQDKNKCLMDFNEILKIELINNNLLQKIFYAKMDFSKKEIIIPIDYYIKFFDFYIRLPIFKDKSLNDDIITKKVNNIILKIISSFSYFEPKQIDGKFKKSIFSTLQDVEVLSQYISFDNQVRNLMDEIKSNLN
ncbi:MAG: Mov34/MPN/PAD-1 family protein [Promethearchaeota archaeon]